MKTKFIPLFAFVFLCGLSVSAQKSEKPIPEKEKEVIDQSAKTVGANEKQAPKEVIPDQYVILFDESIVVPFIKTGDANETDREKKKAKADEHEKRTEVQLRKLAMEKFDITPAMIKSVFSTTTTGIVVQLKNDKAKGLKAKMAQVKEAAALIPDFIIQSAEVKSSARIPEAGPVVAQSVGWGTSFVTSMNYTGNKWAWILDTGIDLDHPDLNVGVAQGANFTSSGAGMDDMNGHGTHCAGIVGAKNNTIGSLGVAAGARVIPVKVLGDNGNGSFSWLLQGLNHVGRYYIPGDVVNMSLNGPAPDWFTDTFVWWDDRKQAENAIRNLGNAGVHMVIAAGNSATHANNETPARTNGTRVYTVSACDWALNLASFSNHGNGPIDYAAPGVSIYSTYRSGGYAYLSGTSMAAPFVAGILLANNGVVNTRGVLNWDRDSNRDPIAVRQ